MISVIPVKTQDLYINFLECCSRKSFTFIIYWITIGGLLTKYIYLYNGKWEFLADVTGKLICWDYCSAVSDIIRTGTDEPEEQ